VAAGSVCPRADLSGMSEAAIAEVARKVRHLVMENSLFKNQKNQKNQIKAV
jgi:hypothetical protein